MPPDVATVPVTGTWYRHVPAGVAPMPGEPAPDGRWQRGGQVAGLYLAKDKDTMWAEWYRALAELGEPPDTRLPRDVWRFRVQLERVADMSEHGALPAVGLPDMLPDRWQWATFQDVGVGLAKEGFQAVLFHSSARPAGLCLCVFGAEQGFAGVTPSGRPERVTAAPPAPRGMRT